jgi:DNA-binding SARP family transcriptional activator/predicted ATPase
MPQLALQFLGTFQVAHHGRVLTNFHGEKVRALLIYLAMEHGRAHRRETLANLLWEEMNPTQSRNNLRKALHHLRHTLDTAHPGLSDQLLSLSREDITWHGQLVQLDVDQLRQASDPSQLPLRTLCDIAELYQGELLPGVNIATAPNFEQWLHSQRQQLHQIALRLFSHLSQRLAAQGELAQASHYAQRHIELEPLDEAAYQWLMALYQRQGRRAEALRLYEQLTQLLAAELGVEPSPELVQMGARLRLAQTEKPNLHYFNTAVTPFLGRTSEQQQLTTLLYEETCRLITITGLGGTGKTRLVQHWLPQLVAQNPHPFSQRFPAGGYFISLEPVTQADQLWIHLAQQLGLELHGQKPAASQLPHYLADQAILLVLDNVEHLLPDIAPLLGQLLGQTKRLKLVATSRTPLHLAGEWVYALGGLSYQQDEPDSVAKHLFVQTAQRVRPGFQPTTADLQAIHQICALAEGLPLAIEMAASWVRLADCATIAQQMGQNLDFLSAPWAHQPERQKSLRVVLWYAWMQLSAEAQTALGELSLFQERFTLAAVTAVLPPAWAVLGELLDHFLLQQAEPNLYYFHPLVHQFVQEKQAERGGVNTAVQHRYTQYYLGLLSDTSAQLVTTEAGKARQTLRTNWVNIVPAWHMAAGAGEWALLQQAAPGLVTYLRTEGVVEQATGLLTPLFAQLPPEGDSAGLRWFLRWQQARLYLDENYQEAATQLAELAELGVPSSLAPDDAAQFWAEYGSLLWRVGSLDEAEVLLLRAENTAVGPHPFAIHHRANLHIFRNDPQTAHPLYAQALRLYRQQGNLLGQAGVLHDLGIGYHLSHSPVEALHYLQESLDLYRELNDHWGIALATSNLIYLHLLAGEDGAGIALATELLASVLQGERFEPLRGGVHCNLGHLYARQGRSRTAAHHYRQALWSVGQCYDYFLLADTLVGMLALLVQELGKQEVVLVGVGEKHGRELTRAATLLGAIHRLEQDIHFRNRYEAQLLEQLTPRLTHWLTPQQLEHYGQIGANLTLQELILTQTIP